MYGFRDPVWKLFGMENNFPMDVGIQYGIKELGILRSSILSVGSEVAPEPTLRATTRIHRQNLCSFLCLHDIAAF